MKTITLVMCLFYALNLQSRDKDQKTYISKTRDETMVYIPSGTFQMQTIEANMYGEKQAEPIVVSAHGFFISPYETSNIEYLEYLHYLKVNKITEAYAAALPDTLVWRTPLAFGEPYVEYYFRHPAYRHYPMVGVTHKQATDYCIWLTTVYNKFPGRKYKKVVFRLPTKAEWYYAAISRPRDNKWQEVTAEKYPAYDYEALFPWDGTYLQTATGERFANFSMVDQASVRALEGTLRNDSTEISDRFLIAERGGEPMAVAGKLTDYGDLTAPVFTFGANAMGLYNMAGNVEEFVADYGITKGGSWRDTGFYLRNDVEELYDTLNEATSMRGFRVAMDVLEEWP